MIAAPDPCEVCERNAYALEIAGGHIEVMARRSRPAGLLNLAADDLIEAVGGKRRDDLMRLLAGFDPEVSRRARSGFGAVGGCRHQGGIPRLLPVFSDPEPPWVLNAKGNVDLLPGPDQAGYAGVVGARRADAYGRHVAEDLSREVASAGGVVVSGLAFGVDAAAHRGALISNGGRTIAVVGGGIDRPYPKQNAGLHAQIASAGLVIGEMPLGSGVWRWSFPARNRLIASLSTVVVVVQAAARSGSLHTADAALARGKPVAAVPGRIDLGVSEGSNGLLADGAMMISSSESLLDLLGLEAARQGGAVPTELEGAWGTLREGRAVAVLDSGGIAATAIRSDLARLELLGLAARLPGGEWVART
jgi:DNA processing protein